MTWSGAALALAIAQSATAASGPNAKLWSGTGKLNSAQSKFTAPDFSEKSETRTYAVSGNKVTMHSSFVGGTGKTVKWSYSASWDGKTYPTVGNPTIDRSILTAKGGPTNDTLVFDRVK